MSEHNITLQVNEIEHRLVVESRKLLVHVLRDDLGYTGTNIGCESSLCGACTVHLNGSAIKSCTIFAVQADMANITTVEGLAKNGELHPIQSSFQEEHGLQCGYCTPGMMLTALDFLKHHSNPSRDEIREGLEGNLCRCTGYHNIINAVESTANKFKGNASGGSA